MADKVSKWVRLRTPSLRVYYHNPQTDATEWDAPPGAVISEEPVIEEHELDAAALRLGSKRSSLAPPRTALRGGSDPSAAAAIAVGQPINKATRSKKVQSLAVPPSSKQNKQRQTRRKTQQQPKNKGSTATTKSFANPMVHRVRDARAPTAKNDRHLSSLTSHASGMSRSGISEGSSSNDGVPCCSMPMSVWLLFSVPALLLGASGAYYNVAKSANRDEQAWPSTPNGQGKMYNARWDNDAISLRVYAQSGVQYREKMYEAPGSNVTCQSDFAEQVGNTTSELCEAYTQLCQLGGDTPTYFPELYYVVLGLWVFSFIFMWLMLPFLRRRICKTKGHIPHDVDLRVVMCIVGTGMAFAAMLFLVHEGRVIAVPNGHSMYTFWVFYSCYVAITTIVYWMRMDVQLIKARNPELSIGAAFVGYLISCNIMGSYYVTGIQSWPCAASTFVTYILFPIYFLSFTRRGLEVWSVHRHHKMILKTMKALEFDSIAGNVSDSETESDTDDESNYRPGGKAMRMAAQNSGDKQPVQSGSGKTSNSSKISKRQHQQAVEDAYGEHTYDPELAAEIRNAKNKRDKIRAKKAKKRRKKKKKKKAKKTGACCGLCCGDKTNSLTATSSYMPSSNPARSGGKDGRVDHNSDVELASIRKENGKIPLSPSQLGGNTSSISSSSPRLKRRVSTADLKQDMQAHEEGRLGDTSNTTLSVLWRDPFKAVYWFIVVIGFLFFVYRNIRIENSFFNGRFLGEVGCIARQGNGIYTGIMIFFCSTQLLSLILLRKVKDEFAVRAELTYVTIASSILIPIHLAMLIFSRNWTHKEFGFSGGCSKEFVATRAGVSLNDQACVVTIYAFWLALILIGIIHTASIAYPVGLTMAQGAEKLREASVITAANFNGPKVLASFETAMQDPLCAKYFRKFLAQEFTLDNMRILVEIDNFKTTIDPSSAGVIKTLAGSRAGITLENTEGTLARACHTVSAWECLSGNMPVTLLSVAGRKRMMLDVEVKDMVRQARGIVKKYFSNQKWCKLYNVDTMKAIFNGIYRSLISIQNGIENPPHTAFLDAEGHEHRLLRKLFVLFDDLLDVVHKSLREESYPNFVARSQIGIDLAKRLKLAEDAQMRFADKGLHF